MSRIREYTLSIGSGSDVQLVHMPVGAKPVGVVGVSGDLKLLMLIDPPRINVDRIVRVLVDEVDVPDISRYVGSAFVTGTLYHVFVGRYVNDPRRLA